MIYCFNIPEIVIDPVPSCASPDVARVELTGESLTGPGALDDFGLDTILAAIRGTLLRTGGTVVQQDFALRVSPPATSRRLCGSFALSVPTNGRRVVSVRATDSDGVADDDLVTFVCLEDIPVE